VGRGGRLTQGEVLRFELAPTAVSLVIGKCCRWSDGFF
jgi:hypothetical protein